MVTIKRKIHKEEQWVAEDVYYSNKKWLLNESETMDIDQVTLVFDLNENRGSGEAGHHRPTPALITATYIEFMGARQQT